MRKWWKKMLHAYCIIVLLSGSVPQTVLASEDRQALCDMGEMADTGLQAGAMEPADGDGEMQGTETETEATGEESEGEEEEKEEEKNEEKEQINGENKDEDTDQEGDNDISSSTEIKDIVDEANGADTDQAEGEETEETENVMPGVADDSDQDPESGEMNETTETEEITGSEEGMESVADEILETGEPIQEDGELTAADFLDDVFDSEEPVGLLYAVGRSSIGISDTNPVAGQENSYDCTNGVQTWTVPASGRYRISCYGGLGGTQNLPGDTLSGGHGSVRQGTIRLEKGTVLYIHVGGNGGDGSRHSNGDPEGNPGSYNGGAGAGYDTSDLGNHGRYWTHGAGGGASDVRLGGNALDNQIMVAGGGGGANKKTGGSGGDSGSYNGRRLEGSDEGGGGGYYGGNAHQGGSSYVNTGYFTDVAESGGSTSGRVTIRLISLYPRMQLSAPTGWTNQDVTIRGTVLHNGEGLPGAYLSWEKNGSGADIWTAANTYNVSQNGTYKCRIRDNAGSITEQSITVSNIDRLEPVIKEITASEEEWTKEDVVLTALAEDAAATAQYGRSGLPAQAYLWGGVDASGNVIWGYGGREENEGEEEETKTDVQAESNAEQSGETKGEKPQPAPEWTAANTFTVSGNGTYVCRVRDTAGNVAETTYEVTNIDRLAPEMELCPSDKEWTREDITIETAGDDQEAQGPDGKSGIPGQGYAWGVMEAGGNITWFPAVEDADDDEEGGDAEGEETEETPDLEGGNTMAGDAIVSRETDRQEKDGDVEPPADGEQERSPVWTGQSTLNVSQNGTYVCLIRDGAGNETQKTIRITNMDRLVPEGVLKADTEGQVRKVVLTVTAQDGAATERYGSSGIQDYRWEMPGTGLGVWTEEKTCEAVKNGIYVCHVRDRAGNITSLTKTVANIDESPPKEGGSDSGTGGESDSGTGSGSGSEKPPADDPVKPMDDPEGPGPGGNPDPDISSLLRKLKGIFEEGGELPEGRQTRIARALPGRRVWGKEKDGENADEWRSGHAPEKGERKKTGHMKGDGYKGVMKEENPVPDMPAGRNFLRWLSALAAVFLGCLLLFVLFLILLYFTRSAEVLSENTDGEYVTIGRRGIFKRRDVWQIRIDRQLYARADTDAFAIRPWDAFVEKNKGEWMLVLWQDRQIPVMIEEEIRLNIPSGGEEKRGKGTE